MDTVEEGKRRRLSARRTLASPTRPPGCSVTGAARPTDRDMPSEERHGFNAVATAAWPATLTYRAPAGQAYGLVAVRAQVRERRRPPLRVIAQIAVAGPLPSQPRVGSGERPAVFWPWGSVRPFQGPQMSEIFTVPPVPPRSLLRKLLKKLHSRASGTGIALPRMRDLECPSSPVCRFMRGFLK